MQTTLHKLVEDGGLRAGHTASLPGGYKKYVKAGWMWRERSENQWFLSPDDTYEHRRYLPAETIVIVER